MTPRAWLLFALSSVIWGLPYLFIKVAVDADIPPAFIAWSRVALGAVLVLPLAWWRGVLPGLRSRCWPIAAFAACEIAVPFILIAIGERHLSSSLTAILIASMPLLVALLSTRFSPADKPTGLRLFGLFIGLGGVVALLGVDVAGRPDELLGAALGSLAGLGVVCTALGLVVFFQLIAAAGPSRASVITYVNPVVAVVLGVLVLHEHLGLMSVAGLLLILAGSWLSTGGGRSRIGPLADRAAELTP